MRKPSRTPSSRMLRSLNKCYYSRGVPLSVLLCGSVLLLIFIFSHKEIVVKFNFLELINFLSGTFLSSIECFETLVLLKDA